MIHLFKFNQTKSLRQLLKERKYHMFTAANHQVYFKHNRSKTTTGHKPKSTLCIIKRGEQVVAQGSSKPAEKILIPIDDKTDVDVFGRRLKEILKTDDGKKFAIISADKFNYREGRKEALTKALKSAGFNREQRTAVWKQYHQVCK